MATTVIATATTTIVARCGCCGGTGGGSGGSGRSRRSCGSRCWARLVGIELRHLGCATDVFGSTITRLPTLPPLAVQRIFFQSALVLFAGRGRVGFGLGALVHFRGIRCASPRFFLSIGTTYGWVRVYQYVQNSVLSVSL